MFRPAPNRRAFSLIELLLVISIMAIVAGLVLPNSNPSIHERLQSAARIVSGDLAYARSLAVTHNSTYRVDFDLEENCYVLSHSGSDASLDTLPDSPWRDPDDPPHEHVVALEELPHLGTGVRIAAVAEGENTFSRVSYVEFGPLGETTRSAQTVIWLAAGGGTARRYLLMTVNPVTGLTSIGPFTAAPPRLAPVASPMQ